MQASFSRVSITFHPSSCARTVAWSRYIVFPVPSMCQFLPPESKDKVMQHTECNEQGSKVDNFFKRMDGLHEEMVCQKELRG
jgi:hypothetical protein